MYNIINNQFSCLLFFRIFGFRLVLTVLRVLLLVFDLVWMVMVFSGAAGLFVPGFCAKCFQTVTTGGGFACKNKYISRGLQEIKIVEMSNINSN